MEEWFEAAHARAPNRYQMAGEAPSLGHTHIGGWNETMSLFAAMLRCGKHFSLGAASKPIH